MGSDYARLRARNQAIRRRRARTGGAARAWPAAMTGREHLARWAESGLTALIAAVLLWQGADLAWYGGWWGWWLGWVLMAAGAGVTLWCVAAVQRARVRGHSDGPGMVVIEERRIGYYGPEGGGFIDIDDLVRIELVGRGARLCATVSVES